MSASRITLRKLQIFAAIATAGGTTAGARALALSQSATSTALLELEAALGTPLFDRVGKRLLLNDEGRSLLATASDLLAAVKDVEDGYAAARGTRAPDLKLAASTTIGNYVMPRLLAEFRRTTPMARVQLRIDNTEAVARTVEEFGADLGLIEGPCHADALALLPWIEDELVIVAGPGHALARAAAVQRLTLRQLRQAPWLLRERGSGTREAVEQVLLPHLQHLPADMTLGSSEAIKNAVAQGLGISCLSRYVVQDLVAARKLAVLATTLPALRRRFALVHRRDKRLSASLKAFIALCRRAAA
jgi:DNA-binding transcriptional LysR family regulator